MTMSGCGVPSPTPRLPRDPSRPSLLLGEGGTVDDITPAFPIIRSIP